MLRPTIANEPDRATRERLDRAMWEATEEHLNPLYLERRRGRRARRCRRSARRPTSSSTSGFGLKLDDLAAQCRAFLDSTERLYEQSIDRGAPRAARDRARRGEAVGRPAHLIRSPQWDESFPGDLMLPALERDARRPRDRPATRQANVHLDIEQRPQKSPRAFCAPIEVPDKVMLVIQPIGGADDWRALFHEAGHTEHYREHVARRSRSRSGDSATRPSPRAGRCCSST